MAVAQLDAAVAWWAANHADAPSVLPSEVEAALVLIGEQPRIGVRVQSARRVEVRRHPMRRVNYYVYYVVHPANVEVVAFWHASRGAGPSV